MGDAGNELQKRQMEAGLQTPQARKLQLRLQETRPSRDASLDGRVLSRDYDYPCHPPPSNIEFYPSDALCSSRRCLQWAGSAWLGDILQGQERGVCAVYMMDPCLLKRHPCMGL